MRTNTTIDGILALAAIILLACIPTHGADVDSVWMGYVVVIPAADKVELKAIKCELVDVNEQVADEIAGQDLVNAMIEAGQWNDTTAVRKLLNQYINQR